MGLWPHVSANALHIVGGVGVSCDDKAWPCSIACLMYKGVDASGLPFRRASLSTRLLLATLWPSRIISAAGKSAGCGSAIGWDT